jgi:hypothetical protein
MRSFREELAFARQREAELLEVMEEFREPVGDIATLWPILKPDPLVADLLPVGEERMTWWQRLFGGRS